MRYNEDYKNDYIWKNNTCYLKKGVEITTYGGKMWNIDDWQKYKNNFNNQTLKHNANQFDYAFKISPLFFYN